MNAATSREVPKTDRNGERPRNPRCEANIFEIITFSWMSNLIKTGRLRDLNETDLYATLDDHKSSSLGDQLEKTWKSELSNAYLVNRKPSLLRALIRMFGANYMFHGFIFCMVEIILNISQPILISGLLAYFNPDSPTNDGIRYAYICATALVFSLLMKTTILYSTHQENYNESLKIRIACSSLIFRKALCLSYKACSETTVGQVINLISNDVNRFEFTLSNVHYLWIGPLQTTVATYFLWNEIGVASLIGIATLLFFIPLQGWIGKKMSEVRLKTAKQTDERIRLMNEIILGIQVIKMYTWEKPFRKLVEYTRKMEVKHIKESTFIRFISLSFKVFQTRFQIFISILMYILLGNNISVQKAFVITSFFNLLHGTMAVHFSLGLLQINELIVSIKRIQKFLLLEDNDHHIPKSHTSVENGVNQLPIVNDYITNNCKDFGNKSECMDNVGIVILNAHAKWTNDQTSYTLEQINLTVRSGQLFAVIGPMGAGKSSLIKAILRELPISQGKISVLGEVSYASQEPWLFSASIQQNILFGSVMDKERFKQIVEICALKKDLEQFSLGDKTIVGERGITLSGGQRARINLARALYKQADIYLLDDPFSAVDIEVGKHLFEKCIKDFLKEKICILITHQVQHLCEVDQIILMDNGLIVTEGSYHDLQASSFDFAKLLLSAEGTKIENNTDSNEINDSVDTRIDSPLHGSKKSIITSTTYENQFSDDQVQKLSEKSARHSNGYNLKNAFKSYIKAGGSTYYILFFSFMCILTQVLTSGGDFWLSFWVNQETYVFQKLLHTSHNSSTSVSHDSNSSTFVSNFQQHFVIVYVLLMVSLIVSVIIKSTIFVKMTTNASINLHNQLFNSIIRTTMYFFNTNSSGQILNCFSKDLGDVDEILPDIFFDTIQVILFILGSVFIVGLTNMYLFILTFIVGIIIYKLRDFYAYTSQRVKKLQGTTLSPVIAHMNASLQGLITIRAYKVENILSQEFDKHQDLHSSTLHLSACLNLGFGFWMDIICIVYIIIVISIFIVLSNKIYGGSVGLALTQIIALLFRIQYGVRQSTILENQMTSVARLLEYTHLPNEDTHKSTADKAPPKKWPCSGKIVFQNFNLRYSLDSPYVLKDLNIQIKPMEKVGIVGRTGAGKSSFVAALFRLALNEGNIIIDDVDIHELALSDLRSKLSIIPQEPVLFSGTMRTNLDPFDEYPDHAIWKALDEVELRNFVENLPDGINSKISTNGSNFSVGQKQLVCLARAIIQNNRILVMDEATANVDPMTDKLIQNTIRNKFRFCTVLTIAHRLNTVMDCDRVLVMDFGKIVEFDHPYSLLNNTDGVFYKMVEQTGIDTYQFLHSMASEFETSLADK